MYKVLLSVTALVASILVSGCTTGTRIVGDGLTIDELDSLSWSAFCRCRGYKLNDYSDKAINEYLDAWIGTVDEEESLDSIGVARC